MLIRQIFIQGLVMISLLAGSAVFADVVKNKSAIYQMAEIMHRLKHFPSPTGLDVLRKITQSKDATKNERTIATAMMNLQHKVAPDDATKLKVVIESKMATADERALASIVLELDHRPTKEDKAKLKAMMH